MEAIPLGGLIVIRGLDDGSDSDLVRYLASKGTEAFETTPCEDLARFSRKPNSFHQHDTTGIDFSVLYLKYGLDLTLRNLSKFKESICICLLVLPDVEKIMEWNRVASVADATIELRREDTNLIANITRWERNGKVNKREEIISVQSEPFRLEFRKYQASLLETVESAPEPSLSTSFDIGLNLKRSERAAKESLELPFTKMQNEQGLVDIRMGSGRKVRAGGRVIYTPDQDDDLDDSDPDDDLNL
ncbi:unnamed protein product, partial [Mesorhabditis belari]|uniref:Elongator complex protein 5 n=1 Tax=Mesorhabditis belari TaxID=2138241 RepID=A0AAF3J6F0_9BILA